MSQRVQILGHGLYSLADVSRYARLHEARVRSWFTTRADTRSGQVFRSDYPRIEGRHVVSFLDLIEAWMAGELRKEGVSMLEVRRAHAKMKLDLNTRHPFAHGDIYTDGRKVFVESVYLAEVVSRQGFFPRVKETLKHIEYRDDTRMASRWTITDGVVIDPTICFGQPVVKGTGKSTWVISNSYHANKKNVNLVADIFGITPPEVEYAVEFEARYGRRDVA